MDPTEEKVLLELLADQIEYDDQRGLKFHRAPSQPMAKSDPSRYKFCAVPTASGGACPIAVTPGRPACHIHDPLGKNVQGRGKAYRTKMVGSLMRAGYSREEILGKR